MNLFKILERCRENAEKWEEAHKGLIYPANYRVASKFAAQDWRTLESEILASIDEEQKNNQPGGQSEN